VARAESDIFFLIRSSRRILAKHEQMTCRFLSEGIANFKKWQLTTGYNNSYSPACSYEDLALIRTQVELERLRPAVALIFSSSKLVTL